MAQKIKILTTTTNGLKLVTILRKNLTKYKQDKRFNRVGKVWKRIKQGRTVSSKIKDFTSDLTGIEGKEIKFKIRQDVLKKVPETIIKRLTLLYRAVQFKAPRHPYIRFILTLKGKKISTKRKEKFAVSSSYQDRTLESVEVMFQELVDHLYRFFLEESPDWDYLTATRFVIKYAKRIEDEN